jgi:sulfatase maturation enzyme AslB (radical SAM superfamily)
MWGIKQYYLGHIRSSDPLRLKRTVVGEPCTRCDIFNMCGGRCLYANVTKRWNAAAYKAVCGTVKNLIEALASQMPRIKELIERGRISTRDFEFMKFNGCEIIP